MQPITAPAQSPCWSVISELSWNAALLAALACAAALAIVMALPPSLGHLHTTAEQFGKHPTKTSLPLTDPQGRIVCPGFPADRLFNFRFYSVAPQVILWAAIGLCYTPRVERLVAETAQEVR